jgi:CheY-like chemotaxis protein
MSHELRTPLNAVLGFAELLEMDAMSADQNTLTSEQKEIVERIIKGGQHLLNLINEVLDIARIETGRLAVSLEAVPLSEVIQESLALIAPMAADRNIELMAREVPNPNSHVEADRQRLKQVLLNLLSNAVKYNRDGGSIVLSCEDALQNRLRIEVSDTGVGIPSDKLDQIFLPFSRLNLGFTGVDGTGIGLALSKGLVELMGGEIGVKSRVGEGSTFWVELALAEAPEDVYQHETLAIPALDPEQTSGTRTVLYIEDNLSNLDLIQRILSRRREIRLVTALQGRLGLDLATQHRPDLILLDMNLPDIPGEEVLRRLRDAPQTRWLPVIVISADATAERIQGALAIGARAYLTKPLSVGKLLTAMRETLNQPANV